MLRHNNPLLPHLARGLIRPKQYMLYLAGTVPVVGYGLQLVVPLPFVSSQWRLTAMSHKDSQVPQQVQWLGLDYLVVFRLQ